MSRRRLRPDEEELWRKVTEHAERLHPEKRFEPSDFVTLTPNPPTTERGFEAIPQTIFGPRGTPKTQINLKPSISEQVGSAQVQMDRKSFDQLKRGKLRPEGKIDLHGMTLDRAHPALTRFILGAQAQGKRLVLVVTGKGKRRDEDGPIPVRHGVLRHQLPEWLSMPPLSPAILQVTQAHLRHGGGGAYYVYLRKYR
jgi:DNA-nicking Smr family endonuclease